MSIKAPELNFTDVGEMEIWESLLGGGTLFSKHDAFLDCRGTHRIIKKINKEFRGKLMIYPSCSIPLQNVYYEVEYLTTDKDKTTEYHDTLAAYITTEV